MKLKLVLQYGASIEALDCARKLTTSSLRLLNVQSTSVYGESVCNNRKNNTTHSLHSLVHNVYVISKKTYIFCTTKQQLLLHSVHFVSDMLEKN